MSSTVAELRTADGEVCASATGRFLPMKREDALLTHEDFFPDSQALSPAEVFRED